MIFWYTEIVGWMVRGKESIEKTVESTFPYKTDVTNLHGGIQFRGTGLPQSMPVCRMLYCKLGAEDVIVGHR